MSVRVKVSDRAGLDVYSTAEFMAGDSPDAAAAFYRGFKASLAVLAQQPGAGRVHESPEPGLRAVRWWPVKGFASHLIFYHQDAGGVLVLRVLHGARDINAQLGRSDPL